MTPIEAYSLLVERAQETALLHSCTSLLGWDQETGLPPRGAPHRAAQLGHLSTLAHERWTAPEVGGWIDRCSDAAGDGFNEIQAANIREWKRSYTRAAKLPARLVADLARETSLAHADWVEARRQANFQMFAPRLSVLIGLVREVAECVGYKESSYDALLDEYEPGATTAQITELFDRLAPALRGLVTQGEKHSQQHPGHIPPGPYPIAAQALFNKRIAEAFGFDFNCGRIDTAVHPFCTTLGPHDIRLTTRYDEENFTDSLYSVIHEVGHGLYEQGFEPDTFGLPRGSAAGLGIHESQSRFWENHVARTLEFWKFALPIAAGFFPQLQGADPLEILRAVNRCRRSFIRVESDAVSYDAHIILRFRIEAALINEKLDTQDIPTMWNKLFLELFDLEVPNDALGCLQDIHWSHGSFGYFPSYTLGNLNAAQLMDSARRAMPDLSDQIEAGDFSKTLSWLRDKIHKHGMTHSPEELIRNATGSSPSEEAHLQFLAKMSGTY